MRRAFSMDSVYMGDILMNEWTREWRSPLSHATNTGECIYKIKRWCERVCAVCQPSCMEILLIDHLKVSDLLCYFIQDRSFCLQKVYEGSYDCKCEWQQSRKFQSEVQHTTAVLLIWGLRMLLSQLQLWITFKVHAEAGKERDSL